MKELLQQDLDVFLEEREFAQEITIDGVTLLAQVMVQSAEKSQRLSEQFDGLAGEFLIVYFKAQDYCDVRKRIPRHGEYTIINDKRFDVISSYEELGIAKMVCSAYRMPQLR